MGAHGLPLMLLLSLGGQVPSPQEACGGSDVLTPCEEALVVQGERDYHAMRVLSARLDGCEDMLAARTATTVAALAGPDPAPAESPVLLPAVAAGMGLVVGVLAVLLLQ